MMNSLHRMTAVALKEVKQLRRDRLTFGMIVGLPLLQILLFGYSIDLDVREIRAAVSDQAMTSQSRELRRTAEHSQIVDIIADARDAAELQQWLDDGAIDVGIVIPPDFERRLLDPSRPAAQLLINGSDPTIESIARQLTALPPPEPSPGAHKTAEQKNANLFAVRSYYNPEGRSAVFIVPGLIGVILNLTMVLFTAIAIVRERERGNLELLITTPVGTPELMLGKILPYVLIGLLQVTIILGIGIWLFDVVVRGSLMDLYLASSLFIFATLTLGLLISTIARTQFQAMQLTVFTFLPSILLSGFMFPFEGMPEVAQWLAEVLPLTHFERLVRGIVLRGSGLAPMSAELWALAGFAAVIMAATLLRFHKRLD